MPDEKPAAAAATATAPAAAATPASSSSATTSPATPAVATSPESALVAELRGTLATNATMLQQALEREEGLVKANADLATQLEASKAAHMAAVSNAQAAYSQIEARHAATLEELEAERKKKHKGYGGQGG